MSSGLRRQPFFLTSVSRFYGTDCLCRVHSWTRSDIFLHLVAAVSVDGLAIEALLKHLLYFPQDVVRASSVEYGTEATIAGTGNSIIR